MGSVGLQAVGRPMLRVPLSLTALAAVAIALGWLMLHIAAQATP